jgi:hypothetical protein
MCSLARLVVETHTVKSVAALDAILTRTRAAGTFSEADLEQLPDAVQRSFRRAIAPGTPLAVAARLRMRGTIKLGRWLRFRAREVLALHEGLVWVARAQHPFGLELTGYTSFDGVTIPSEGRAGSYFATDRWEEAPAASVR